MISFFSVPPKPKSREIEQFGFTIGQPGKVIVTFHANPLPNIEWTVDGYKIQEGARDPTGRFHSSVLVNKVRTDVIIYLPPKKSSFPRIRPLYEFR